MDLPLCADEKSRNTLNFETFATFSYLIRPAGLHVVEAEVDGEGVGEEGHERSLLQLVEQDRGVALP